MALVLKSHAEQVVDHLRAELLRGRWGEFMPGALALKAELGTSGNTIELALRQLETEGFLLGQGAGKRRRIAIPDNQPSPTLRISILLYDYEDRKVDYILDLLHQLKEAGHSAYCTSRTLTDLGMDPEKVAKWVQKSEADAWVVVAASRPVLEWFAVQPFPVFGLFGRNVNLRIASTGPRKLPALQKAVRRLVALGHRRIVFLTRSEHRKPVPGNFERDFLAELEAQGIVTGPYNLPDWEETREGFTQALDSLFQHTPPTALLMDTSMLTVAVLQYFTKRGIQSPRDVSLISMDPDPNYSLCDPAISHISYDSGPWVRHIMRWVNNIAHGGDDHTKRSSLAEFIEGGTIGPAPGKKSSVSTLNG